MGTWETHGFPKPSFTGKQVFSRPLSHPGPKTQKAPRGVFLRLRTSLKFGAWDRGRTGDPSLFRGMLYQLSYPSS